MFRFACIMLTAISLLFSYMIYGACQNFIAIVLGLIAVLPAIYGIIYGELPITASNFQIGLLFFVGALMSQASVVASPLFSIGIVMCTIVSILIMSVESTDFKELLFCFVFVTFVNTMSIYLCSELERHCSPGNILGSMRSI